MSQTKIEWADRVWNPVTGCTKVSEGCRNCYAERMSKRLAGRAGYPEDGFKVTRHPNKLDEPLRWKKPARIFVCSMGDLFHVNVPLAFVDKIIRNIRLSSQHIFLVLTKRPHFMKEYFEQMGEVDNLWLGVSVEDQKTADERIPLLLQTPAAKRFVSYEPALGPVSFRWASWQPINRAPGAVNNELDGLRKLDWVIMGGESGPGARPSHPDWARSVRDQCAAAAVPFFFKQWGEWTTEYPHGLSLAHREETFQFGTHFYRVGKKAAGCLLDGKEHKERP